jgi:tetratricopeptide (TPR) repeat protein
MNDHQPIEANWVGLEALLSRELDPLFWPPQRLGLASAWWAHVPFAFWIVVASRPRLLVELGTDKGVSYAAFCEAVLRARLGTRCFAVDTWTGDDHAGHYGEDVYNDLRDFHDKRYVAFSNLLRSTFDDAVRYFEDGSIDLLHIDGYHTYEAVKHDYETWRPKLSDRAVVLFHDTNVRERDFGVHQFFAEISKQFPSFEFRHGYGLGIAAVGDGAAAAVKRLCAMARDPDVAALYQRFAHIGERWFVQWDLGARLAATDARLGEVNQALSRAQQQAAERDIEFGALRADLASRALEVEELRYIVAGSRAEAAAQRAAFVRVRDELTSLSEALASTRHIGAEIFRSFYQHTSSRPEIRRRHHRLILWLRFALSRKNPIMLADRARDAGDWAVAARYYRMALERNPNRPEIWIQYGHALKETGRLPPAEQAYRQAVAVAPTLAEPYRYLGEVLSAQRKRDEAVSAFLQAHSLDPTSPDALSGLRNLDWSEKDLASLKEIAPRTI